MVPQRGQKQIGWYSSKIDLDAIVRVLKANNRDTDGSAITELGFNVGLWNGLTSFPCAINVTCGGYSKSVKNSLVVQLPSDGRALDVLGESSLRQILLGLIAALDPEVAVLTSNDYLNQMGGGAPWEAGGWIVYRREEGIGKLSVNKPIGVLVSD